MSSLRGAAATSRNAFRDRQKSRANCCLALSPSCLFTTTNSSLTKAPVPKAKQCSGAKSLDEFARTVNEPSLGLRGLHNVRFALSWRAGNRVTQRGGRRQIRPTR